MMDVSSEFLTHIRHYRNAKEAQGFGPRESFLWTTLGSRELGDGVTYP